MSPQRLRCRVIALGGDPCHPRVASTREALFIVLTILALLVLAAAPARGQASASLQVAARVVSTEPSRTALALTAEALRTPAAAVRQGTLAQVTVTAAKPARDAAEPRRVRVDFLRN